MDNTVAVFAGSRHGTSFAFNKHAFELGALLAQINHTVLWGGGKNGGMGALSDGVASQDGQMKAYIAQAYYDPNEIFPEHIVSAESCTNDAERNDIFMRANFQIALNGGVGSLLEIVHALNHKIYHDKTSAPLIIISTDGFYNGLSKLLSNIIDKEFNDPSIKDRYKIVPSPRDAIQILNLN